MISISVKKKYEVQYEQPVKITETNEPQGVNKSFVQVSLLKWLLPSSKFYSSVIIYIENLFSPINCVKKVPQCQRSNITGGGPAVSLTYSVSNFDEKRQGTAQNRAETDVGNL